MKLFYRFLYKPNILYTLDDYTKQNISYQFFYSSLRQLFFVRRYNIKNILALRTKYETTLEPFPPYAISF